MIDIDNITTITVIGTGTMGYEIAQVALMAGFKTVIINDLSNEILEKAVIKIKDGLERLEAKEKLNQGHSASNLLENLIKEVDLEKAVSNADSVVILDNISKFDF